jgi:hypothetical protein
MRVQEYPVGNEEEEPSADEANSVANVVLFI